MASGGGGALSHAARPMERSTSETGDICSPRLYSPASEWDRPRWQRRHQGNSLERLLLLNSMVTVDPRWWIRFSLKSTPSFTGEPRGTSTPGVVGGCGPGREGGHLPSPRPITKASPPPTRFTRQLPRPACINHHQLSGTSVLHLHSSSHLPRHRPAPTPASRGVDRGRGRDAGRARSALLRSLASSIVTGGCGHRILQTSRRSRDRGWVCGLGMHPGCSHQPAGAAS